MTKDTATGQLNTVLISPLGSRPDGGLEPRAEWDNKVPQPHRPTVGVIGYIPGTLHDYPDNNPKTAVGAKKIPLEVVPPSAVHALAEAFADGAKKYGPYNWREKTISSSVYYGAALRHLCAWWDGEDYASDSGVHHLYHALACIAMVIDGDSVGKLNDNRPPKGAASAFQKRWVEKASNDNKFTSAA